MHYYFVVSSHKANSNVSHLCSLGSFLGSFVEVWLDFADNGPPLPVENHQVLNNGHSDGHHHRSHISELVELDELGVFFVIHLVDIAKEVGLSALLGPLFAESRVCFRLELHSEYLASLYLFFELELYHGDSDNHWVL